MLNKLTLRNAKRSVKDYLIYIVTMTIISTLMFSLNGMIFSKSIQALTAEASIFAVFIGLGSFFIIMIIIWLVHYMVRFMMQKRSKEFGTYLLLGMKKIEIAKLFRREQFLLGLLSFLLGILPGIFFQTAFTNIFYSIVEADRKLAIEFSPWNLLLTGSILLISYGIALLRIKRDFKKMNIHDLIYLDQQIEEIKTEKSTWKKYLAIFSALYILIFNIMVITSSLSVSTALLCTLILIAAIYLLYYGLSSFFISYIEKKRAAIYKKANLFVLRQLAAKIKTMRVTMGTLTILFTLSLLGWTTVTMFAGWQKSELKKSIPYDVLLFSDQTDFDFASQLNIIEDLSDIRDSYIYNIYENNTADFNEYLYDHLNGTSRGDTYSDGKVYNSTYFAYDTYISLSDYNYIRTMLGYETVALNDQSYLIHGKERLAEILDQAALETEVTIHEKLYNFQQLHTEPLQQTGLNGADYLIVVPDDAVAQMQPLYSLLAVMLKALPPTDLEDQLSNSMIPNFDNNTYEEEFQIQYGSGSDNIISFSGTVMVRENSIVRGGYLIASLCYMLAYMGVVFLCAALTILAIQQLSDSAKFKFRYSILSKLGLSRKEIDKVVLKQLSVYYLCPYVISIILSIFIGLFASERFVYYTGVKTGIFSYYTSAMLVFTVLYLVYFTASYVGFVRNIRKK